MSREGEPLKSLEQTVIDWIKEREQAIERFKKESESETHRVEYAITHEEKRIVENEGALYALKRVLKEIQDGDK
jgi:hypothetical protein